MAPEQNDRPMTRREVRRISDAEARIGAEDLPNVQIEQIEPITEATREIVGETPSVPPIVESAERRISEPVTEILGRERDVPVRQERGAAPRQDGNAMARRLSDRISRITRRINSSPTTTTPDETDESSVEVTPYDGSATSGRVSDPWKMDRQTREGLLAELDKWDKSPGAFNNRFGGNEIEWRDHTPAEQSAIERSMTDARDELLQTLTSSLGKTEGSETGDYLENGSLTPRSVMRASADMHMPQTDRGAYFYEDVKSLVAMNDFLGSPSWDLETRDAAWRMIKDKQRNAISSVAGVVDRAKITQRASGRIGERTVISGTEEAGKFARPHVREISLSKIQPRRLVWQSATAQSNGKNLSEYSETDIGAILQSAHDLRKSIASWFRTNLGLSDADPISEDLIADWMARTPDQQSRDRIQKYAHNLIVLDDMLGDEDVVRPRDLEWNSLSNQARERILAEAKVELSPRVAKTNDKPKRTRKAPTAPTPPVATASPQENVQSPDAPGGSSIGRGSTENRVSEFSRMAEESQVVATTFDATTATATVTREDGTQETVALSSLGRPNQYDFGNSVVIGDVPYVMENSTQLYRNPVSGEYLTDYSSVPIRIDTDITPARELETVQTKKNGKIVSYPSYSPKASEQNKMVGYGDYNKSVINMLSEIFGIDASEAQQLLGKKIYLAPNVQAGSSTDDFRQAVLLFLATNNNEIPEGEKRNMQLLEIVDIPEGSDATESYLRHIGRIDVANAYVAAGRPADFMDFDNSPSRQAANIPAKMLVHPHLSGKVGSGYRSLQTVFDSGEDGSRSRPIILDMPSTATPRARKMIVLWRHPENYTNNWYYYRGSNHSQIEDIASVVNKAVVSDLPADWYAAYEQVKRLYEEAKSARDEALNRWRGAAGSKSRGPRPRREFIMNGDLVESLETILVDVFGPNMDKIVDSVRNDKAKSAKITNEMARLRRKAQETGLRNVQGLEDSMLYPPRNADGTNMPPRDSTTMLELVSQHSAYGFIPHVDRFLPQDAPIEVTELSQETIDMLALIRLSSEMMVDPETNKPLSEIWRGGDVSSARALHNAIYWATGSKGKALMVTEEEFGRLAAESAVPDDDTPSSSRTGHIHKFYPLRRGINQAKPPMTAHQMAQEFVNGPFYVVGEGGNAGGDGVNFAKFGGGGMGGYGGRDPMGDIILALVPQNARVSSNQLMSTIHGQIMAMAQSFYSQIENYSGIPMDSPIDLDAENDPDWSHDNGANPGFRPDRQNVAHAYYVPWGGRTINEASVYMRDQDQIGRLASSLGYTLPKVDTSDLDGLRQLGDMIQSIGAQLSPEQERADTGDPFGGERWINATRAQVFGWIVQLEILKAMEIAKLKAEGKVPWNDQIANLVRAQEVLTWRGDQVVQGLLFGVDAYTTNTYPATNNPLVIFKDNNFGHHIMVLNRTAIIVLEKPVNTNTEREIMENAAEPRIRKPGDPSKIWNVFTGRWIDDPNYGKTNQ